MDDGFEENNDKDKDDDEEEDGEGENNESHDDDDDDGDDDGDDDEDDDWEEEETGEGLEEQENESNDDNDDEDDFGDTTNAENTEDYENLHKAQKHNGGHFKTRRNIFPFWCCRSRVRPDDSLTISGSDDDSTDYMPSLPLADIRVTLKIVSAHNTVFKDLLAGSDPYLLILPDGHHGFRPTHRTESVWRTSNLDFEETFVFDMTLAELPIKIVLYDQLNKPSKKEKEELQKLYEEQRREETSNPLFAYMRYVLVPDADDDPQSMGGSRRLGETGTGGRPRAIPSFKKLLEAEPVDAPKAWFPCLEPPDDRLGESAFGSAARTQAQQGGGNAVRPPGITLSACYQRIDPETGELLDAVEDEVDETEIDRRALLRFLEKTTNPPQRVWEPDCNWRKPSVHEDVTQWSHVVCEDIDRVRTVDEKTGVTLEPPHVPRVVSLDISSCKAEGSFPTAPEWFQPWPSLGKALVFLRTVYLNDNKLEGRSDELPNWSDLKGLVTLDLSNNRLQGRVDALKLPPSLKVLNLDYNYMKGPINPLWFWSIPKVKVLRLSGNRLKCSIPKRCWHFMPSLEVLYLAQTDLTGAIPKSLADSKELQVLDLSENGELDGEVPRSLLELRRLKILRLVACHRITDTKRVVESLRDEFDVEVDIWGAGVPPAPVV